MTNPRRAPATVRRPCLIVAGPTASGKSALALDVAERFGGVVVNADSMQVYRELRLVTARPSASDEARAPHRLYGCMDGREACSAGRWVNMAAHEIRAAWDADRLPVVAGGTGMYIQGLVDGLSPIPDVPAEVRAEALRLHAELGGAGFRRKLAALDPETARRLPDGDTQRLIRAWEVTVHTGRPFSQWRDEPRRPVLPEARFATIVLTPPRDRLYAAIDRRFAWMVDHGALDEARALMDLDLDPALPVMKALGVPELAACLSGEVALEDAVARAQKVSRNYAKRQLSWLRTQVKPDLLIDAQYSESFREEIFSFVRRFLLTTGA
ncbi:MAG: tRNA (adenosine(37)-N6)-dimethylallyltransferase MiaA [Alphaproteobacteria bacterium]|nr:tRNA (adenosine(37)-N6)-dimethylallyltransferase MiaA [Alphaproteobacteria bacterium]MBF0249661.1 tRNA (adenosine(37)-N6)-dimethylallyltransferase MiaA [Alphaproteobacteria bacterium]